MESKVKKFVASGGTEFNYYPGESARYEPCVTVTVPYENLTACGPGLGIATIKLSAKDIMEFAGELFRFAVARREGKE